MNVTQKNPTLVLSTIVVYDLFSLDSHQNVPEHYPIGIAVSIPSNTGHTKGWVLSVPAQAKPSSSIQDDPV